MMVARYTPEGRAALSAQRKGRPKSAAHREAISAALRAHFQANPKERKESYFSVHGALGAASEHVCISCGQVARDWAYQFTAKEELIHEPQGWPYSLDPDDYAPMCRSCHKRFDYEQMKAWHAEDDYKGADVD